MPMRPYTDQDFSKRGRGMFKNNLTRQQKLIAEGKFPSDPALYVNYSQDYFLWQLENTLDAKTPCPYCKKPLKLDNVTWDHIIPVTRCGGSFRWENGHFCCRSCNRMKGSFTHAEFNQLLDAFREIERQGDAETRKAVNQARLSLVVGSSFRFGKQRRDQNKG